MLAFYIGSKAEQAYENYLETGWQFDPMEYVKTAAYSYRDEMWLIAFRESEAAKAAFAAGLRTKRVSFDKWEWPALGKLQEQ